jgi:hypothetical protein
MFKSTGSSHGGDHDMNADDVGTQPEADASMSDGEAIPGRDAGSERADAGRLDAGEPAVIMGAWPGGAPSTADHDMAFGGNLSGLTFRAATASEPELLWAVQNNPARLFRLERDDAGLWTPSSGAFREGKQLLFPDGGGQPDAEGVTFADGAAVYVASERDGRSEDDSRPSILRFDPRGASDALTATHEWDLTGDLPRVDANEGVEAVTWVADTHLVRHHFRDEARGEPYDPAHYPGHGGGLFFVGLEADGVIYVYALDHGDSSAARVATVESGQSHVMGLEFDAGEGALWAHCDDTCGNLTSVLAIAATGTHAGQFVLRASYEPPAPLAELNDEGIALSDCHAGQRTIFWADDAETDGHAIREGAVPCALFAP